MSKYQQLKRKEIDKLSSEELQILKKLKSALDAVKAAASKSIQALLHHLYATNVEL